MKNKSNSAISQTNHLYFTISKLQIEESERYIENYEIIHNWYFHLWSVDWCKFVL